MTTRLRAFLLLLAVIAALVAIGLSTGCVPIAPPRPPVPPGLPTWSLDVQLAGPAQGTVVVQDGPNAGRRAQTDARGRVLLEQLVQSGFTVCGFADGWTSACVGVTLTRSQDVTIRLTPAAPVWPPIAGRVRVVDGRFRTDRGPWTWRGISEFDLVHLARTGQRAIVLARLEAAARARLTNVRVFAQAFYLFDLTPAQESYNEALDFVLTEANTRGLYVDLCVFPDAQILQPTAAARVAVLRALTARLASHPGVIWELANEPWQNGWASATDPALLALGEQLAAALGHRDFILGDPRDGDNVDASLETIEELKTLAKRSTILALHSSRKGGANPDGTARLRRHVDHLEGFVDAVGAAEKAAGAKRAGVHVEPMGAASVQRVPLPNGRTYEREPDPDVTLAAALTAQFAGLGFTYHRIATQDQGTPGLDRWAAFADVPSDGCRYLNDSWPGAATKGFTWRGGKVRSWVCGDRAWVLAYGFAPAGEVTWANGFVPVRVIDESPADDAQPGSKIRVWEARR